MSLLLPLHTPRLLIRDLKHADLPAFARYRNLPDVSRFQSWDNYTLHDAEVLYEGQSSLAFNTDESWYQLAVLLQEDKILLGDIGIHFFDKDRQVELGMTFDVQHQKQGYAREAINAIIKLMFNVFEKHRITAIVDTRNNDAVNLLEKLNFRREAHFRENVFFKDEWGDEYLYALLKNDY